MHTFLHDLELEDLDEDLEELHLIFFLGLQCWVQFGKQVRPQVVGASGPQCCVNGQVRQRGLQFPVQGFVPCPLCFLCLLFGAGLLSLLVRAAHI